MSEYTQRISKAGTYPNPVMISFDVDLMSAFYDLVGKELKNTGTEYFAHHLIKNHLEAGHTVSSFVTHPDWQIKYWNEFWDCDPLDRASHTIAKANGHSITSWNVVDPNSDCMENRKSLCKVNHGLTFSLKHDNGNLENFSFGWEKFDIQRMNREKLAKLSNMITDFRLHRYRKNTDIFNQPVVL